VDTWKTVLMKELANMHHLSHVRWSCWSELWTKKAMDITGIWVPWP